MPKKIYCPFCGSTTIKHGKTKQGIQRYKCKQCHKTCLSKYNSLAYLKHGSSIIKQFIGYMIDDVSLEVSARNIGIDVKTAHYYRHIVFNALKDYQDSIKLSGTILIDETFVRIREKQYKILRPDGKDIRGLSFNQLCIITMIDLNGYCVAKVSSRAMAQPDDFKRLFNGNMGKLLRIIHDGNPKQVQFMKQYDCQIINARKDDSLEYTTDLVDSLHSNMKRYFFKHAGYRLKYLQHYINFFVYRYNNLSKSKNKNKTVLIKIKNRMIEDLYKHVENSNRHIKYTSYLKDKGITEILKHTR